MTLFLPSSMGFGSVQFLVNVCRFGGVPLAAPFAPRPSIICRVRVPARVPGCLVSAIHPSISRPASFSLCSTHNHLHLFPSPLPSPSPFPTTIPVSSHINSQARRLRCTPLHASFPVIKLLLVVPGCLTLGTGRTLLGERNSQRLFIATHPTFVGCATSARVSSAC